MASLEAGKPKNVVWIRSEHTTKDGRSMWYSKPRTVENLDEMMKRRRHRPRT